MENEWEFPLCLIENSRNGLQISDVTLNKLRKVNVPVCVVAIVGPYRTGKSYILNLLAGKPSGFSLGSTVQAKTKGIWAWLRRHPTKKEQCLLLLDTEGLGDVEKGDKDHDNWIFILAVLLSSTLIYNNMNTIDNDALHALHFITKMSEHVKMKAGTAKQDGTEFDGVFPNFIWAIRDFSLELILDGKPITSDEYLERALTPVSGYGKKMTDFNLVRNCIKNYFSSRKCFTFPQPVRDKNELKHLEILNKSQLLPDFLATSDRFIEYVHKHLECKTIHGTPVNGSGNLAKCYVGAIQMGAAPCIQNAVEATTKLENEQVTRITLESYRSMMLDRIQLPTEFPYQLSRVHYDCKQIALSDFDAAVIRDTESKYHDEVAAKIEEEYGSICKHNEEVSIQKCQQIIQKLYAPISSKIGDFARPEGYESYREEMNNLEDRYLETPDKGLKYQEVLDKFKEDKESEHSSIRAVDWKLREKQEKSEDLKRKTELYRRKQILAEEQKKNAEEQMADQQKRHEEALKKQQEKDQRETVQLLMEREDAMNMMLREREPLHRQVLQQHAEEQALLEQQQWQQQQQRQRQSNEIDLCDLLELLLE